MNILCVCTGNTCRSPMFAALLVQALTRCGRKDVQVVSAGTGAAPGQKASREAQVAMARRGIDLGDHRSRHLSTVDLACIDLVLCMSSAHAAAVRARGMPAQGIRVVNADGGGVPDPFGGDADDYETCACLLASEADRLVASL